MTPAELRARAAEEVDDLGPEPVDRVSVRCGARSVVAVVLLAGLAEWDPVLLKRSALGVASEWTNRDASVLPLDAVHECGR